MLATNPFVPHFEYTVVSKRAAWASAQFPFRGSTAGAEMLVIRRALLVRCPTRTLAGGGFPPRHGAKA